MMLNGSVCMLGLSIIALDDVMIEKVTNTFLRKQMKGFHALHFAFLISDAIMLLTIIDVARDRSFTLRHEKAALSLHVYREKAAFYTMIILL